MFAMESLDRRVLLSATSVEYPWMDADDHSAIFRSGGKSNFYNDLGAGTGVFRVFTFEVRPRMLHYNVDHKRMNSDREWVVVQRPWVQPHVIALDENDQPVLSCLDGVEIPGSKPRIISIYIYNYETPAERTGSDRRVATPGASMTFVLNSREWTEADIGAHAAPVESTEPNPVARPEYVVSPTPAGPGEAGTRKLDFFADSADPLLG